MTYKSIVIFVLCSLGFLLNCTHQNSADLIVLDGQIFTAKDNTHFVEAIAIKNGYIKASGNTEAVLNWQSDSTRIIDLDQKLVVPGFHDAHLHFWSGARLNNQVNLIGVRSKTEALEIIKEAVKESKDGEWIVGRGWDHELWPDNKLPNRVDLDKIAPNNPVFLKRVDGHAAWVNSIVLKMLNYDYRTPDPKGGKIIRYPNSKQPSGILIDSAYEVIDNIIPEPTTIEKVSMLAKAVQYANSLGITSITDNSNVKVYEAYANLESNDRLSMRVHFWVDMQDNLDSLRNYFRQFTTNDSVLNANLIKLFADGSLGSRSAYLLEPYENNPDNFGLPQNSYEDLLNDIRKADRKGWQIGIHAIGDAANRMVLDAYEEVEKERFEPNRRWRIEHAQIVQPSDILRFSELGVIASMQPTHCITDMNWAENRIGNRVKYAYSWKSMLENNVPLAFGTDWPVEPLNPLLGIYAAVTRQDTLQNPTGGWYPEQRLTVGKAVYAYTLGASYAVKCERWKGRLLPGYVADFVVLDRNIFQVSPKEILETEVLATYMNGKKVFENERKN